MPPENPAARRNPGFTLVELLIVISIVLILALIAFMFTRRAMDRAHTVSCSNNLRQIGVGLTGYQQENNGYPSQNSGITWDRAILPHMGYLGDRSLVGTSPFRKSAWAELASVVKPFACPADRKPRSQDRFKRSYSIVPWTTNWSNGTQFRGWKNRPYNKGVPLSIVDEPGRAAMVVEWHTGTESLENLCGGGNHTYHDRGGPDKPEDTLHGKKQIVLFADGHTEMLPFMTNADFVQKYWPGVLGTVD
ncbi:DUF1559 domain-containing protein [Akkermansiaceae bacterium]|nr:DUF1559 domain-containing protein [Akkermansiaceae bacterium]